MLNYWDQIILWFGAALSGMAHPVFIAMALALTTLLVEDVAIAAGVALATQGSISWELSLAAVGGGIALGDVGLYVLGLGAVHLPWLRQKYMRRRSNKVSDLLLSRLPSAILVARVIPGLRFVTYTACGFVEAPFTRFCTWVLIAVTLWTFGLYGLSILVGQQLSNAFGLPAPVAVAIPILFVVVSLPIVRVIWKYFKS
jgi:membrane protein DedA with SNARE-associated domain